MDQKGNDETKGKDAANERFQAEFETLPLEEKFARLFKMEAVTLSETLAYVVNSPMKVVEKVGDIIVDIGKKIEEEARKAASGGAAPDVEPKKAANAAKQKASRKPPRRSAQP